MADVLATLLAELKPPAVAMAEADKPTLKAALPFSLRLFAFGGIWGWVVDTVLGYVLQRGWQKFAAWGRKQTVGDILDTFDALSGIVGAGTCSITVFRHRNEIHDEWQVDGPDFSATFSNQVDAELFAKVKGHDTGVMTP